jgi:hypothetical protein
LRLRKLPGTYTISADSIYRIKIVGTPVSVKDLDYYQITPNPITDYSNVRFKNVKVESMSVINSQGRLEFYATRNVEEEMKRLNKLPQGIYKVIFSTGNRNIIRTIIKQ